jgi:8-oxo-dGTP pyrophosphatase MutT (NUDIX family)
MASEPRVELLWWRECPSWERALAMLREAMEAAGLDPNSVEVREVDTVASPTIRVNGRDIQPPIEGEPTGLACRIYRRRDGRTSPLPDPEDLLNALRAGAVR